MLNRMLMLCVVACTALLHGCSSQKTDYEQLGLVDVTGTVSVDGEPIDGAVITFEDAETGSQSYGLTDTSGSYRLWFNSEKHGIMQGEKKVMVSTTKKVLGLNADEEGGESDPEGGEGEEGANASAPDQEKIPEAYTGKNSALHVWVDLSSTTIDFDLKSDGSTTEPK